MKQDIEILKAGNTGDIFKDAQNIIEKTRKYAYQAVNMAMVQRNWLLGKRIADEELQGENRAEYGKEVIKRLAEYLTELYGKGFTKSNLYQFVQFYKFFPDIFHAVSGKSQILSWTHYRFLLRVTDKKAREYMYVRMYDSLKRTEGDNPTIGLILCSETSEDMARYSVLHENERLFQARYLTYLPTVDQLKEEIELQKEIFRLQQNKTL